MLRAASFWAVIFFAIVGCRRSSVAQTWHGTTYPSSSWNDPQNWIGGVPTNDGTANVAFALTDSIFDADLNSNWSINSATFSGNRTRPQSFMIGGSGTLTINGGLTQTGTAFYNPYAIIGVNVVLPSLQSWSIGTIVTASGKISGGGGLTKSGPGTLILGLGNSYSGGTIVKGGILSISDDSSLGAAAGALQLDGGTVIFAFDVGTYPNGASLSRNVTVAGGGGEISTVKDLDIVSPVSGAGLLKISQDSAGYGVKITLSGLNSLTGGLQLANHSTYTYGRLLVRCLGNEQSLGAGPVALSGNTFLSVNSRANIGPAKSITIGPDNGILVTSDSFNPAEIISPNSAQSYVMLDCDSFSRPLDQSQMGDGSLWLGSGGATPTYYTAASLQPGSGNSYRLGNSPSYGGNSLVLGGHDNVLTGPASLVVSGSVQLLNANDYTGGTTLLTGSLGVGDSRSLGPGMLTFTGGSLAALNGPISINNNSLIANSGGFAGLLTLDSPVDLNGTAAGIGVNGVVTFNGPIGNGSLTVGGSTAVFNAANTFSSLRILNGTVRVSSPANLGGGGTPLTLLGTLETTDNIVLSNIVYGGGSNGPSGTLSVAAGTTLTLAENIPAASLTKSGGGTLELPATASCGGTITVVDGSLHSTGESLANAYLTISGGTFNGSGKVQTLVLNAGIICPAFGTGIINTGVVFSSTPTIQFAFTTNGSPDYSNMVAAKNGLIAFNDLPSGSLFPISAGVDIFLSAPSTQTGDNFRGAFYLKSNFDLIPGLLDGVVFRYYALAPTGEIMFNGRRYTLLAPDQFAVTHRWVDETASLGEDGPIAGKVLQFTVAVPAAPMISTSSVLPAATLYASYQTVLQATGAPNPVFSLIDGSLPPGLYLSPAGIISGTPWNLLGTFRAGIQASNGIEPTSTREFQISVTATYTAWSQFYFVGGPAEVPLGDGTSNLLKFLCGIDPRSNMDNSARASLPALGSTIEGGRRYLTLTFRRSLAAAGLTVGLEASSNLQGWTGITPSFQRVVGTDSATFDPFVQMGLDVTDVPTEMIRLRITTP